jgi:hypothetical protein
LTAERIAASASVGLSGHSLSTIAARFAKARKPLPNSLQQSETMLLKVFFQQAFLPVLLFFLILPFNARFE